MFRANQRETGFGFHVDAAYSSITIIWNCFGGVYKGGVVGLIDVCTTHGTRKIPWRTVTKLVQHLSMHSRRPPSLRHKRNPRDVTRKMRHSALENDDDLEQQQHQQHQQQQQQQPLMLLPSQAQQGSTTSTTPMRKKRKAGNSLFKMMFLIAVLFLLGLICKKYILDLNQSGSNLGKASPILQGVGSVKKDKAGNRDSTDKEKMDGSFDLDQRKKVAQEEKPSKDLVKDQTIHVKDEKEQVFGV